MLRKKTQKDYTQILLKGQIMTHENKRIQRWLYLPEAPLRQVYTSVIVSGNQATKVCVSLPLFRHMHSFATEQRGRRGSHAHHYTSHLAFNPIRANGWPLVQYTAPLLGPGDATRPHPDPTQTRWSRSH